MVYLGHYCGNDDGDYNDDDNNDHVYDCLPNTITYLGPVMMMMMIMIQLMMFMVLMMVFLTQWHILDNTSVMIMGLFKLNQTKYIFISLIK